MEYLVEERAGGLMEMPDWIFYNFNIIDANNEQEARDIYNKRHNCNFFYGSVVGYIQNGNFTLTNNDVSLNVAKQGYRYCLENPYKAPILTECDKKISFWAYKDFITYKKYYKILNHSYKCKICGKYHLKDI